MGAGGGGVSPADLATSPRSPPDPTADRTLLLRKTPFSHIHLQITGAERGTLFRGVHNGINYLINVQFFNCGMVGVELWMISHLTVLKSHSQKSKAYF